MPRNTPTLPDGLAEQASYADLARSIALLAVVCLAIAGAIYIALYVAMVLDKGPKQ